MGNKSIKVNTRLLFVLNLHHFFRYLISWDVMPFLAVFSLSFIIMPFSTLIFGIIYPIVLLMVYKLAFDVLTDVARGNMTPTVKHNYMVSNVVGIKVALLALLIELTRYWIEKSDVYSDYTQDFIILSTFITPAIYMSLAITNSMLHALNPVTIFKIIKKSYLSYFIFVVFWVATIYIVDHIINPGLFKYIPVFINGILSSFLEYSLLILNFQIMGYIMYQHRDEFGLHQIAGFYTANHDFVGVKEEEEVNAYHERIKFLLAEDEIEQALAMAIELQKDGDRSPELMTLYQKAMQKKMNPPNKQELADKVHVLIVRKKIKKAFDIIYDLFENDKDFLEKSANDINPLLKHAVSVNKTKYMAIIMNDFDKKYPNHIDTVENYFILAKVIYKDRKRRSESKQILENLISNYPNDVMVKEIKAWYQGLKLIEKRNSDL